MLPDLKVKCSFFIFNYMYMTAPVFVHIWVYISEETRRRLLGDEVKGGCDPSNRSLEIKLESSELSVKRPYLLSHFCGHLQPHHPHHYCVEVRRRLCGSVFSFHLYMVPGVELRSLGWDSKCLYSLGNLAVP